MILVGVLIVLTQNNIGVIVLGAVCIVLFGVGAGVFIYLTKNNMPLIFVNESEIRIPFEPFRIAWEDVDLFDIERGGENEDNELIHDKVRIFLRHSDEEIYIEPYYTRYTVQDVMEVLMEFELRHKIRQREAYSEAHSDSTT